MKSIGSLSAIVVLTIAGLVIAAGTAGSLDSGFGGDGVVVTPTSPDGYLFGLAVQSDGKVVAVGSDGAVDGGYEWAIRRYLTNGTTGWTRRGMWRSTHRGESWCSVK